MGAKSPGTAAVVPVQLHELDALSSVRIYIPKDLRPPDARQMALKVSSRYSSPDIRGKSALGGHAVKACR